MIVFGIRRRFLISNQLLHKSVLHPINKFLFRDEKCTVVFRFHQSGSEIFHGSYDFFYEKMLLSLHHKVILSKNFKQTSPTWMTVAKTGACKEKNDKKITNLIRLCRLLLILVLQQKKIRGKNSLGNRSSMWRGWVHATTIFQFYRNAFIAWHCNELCRRSIDQEKGKSMSLWKFSITIENEVKAMTIWWKFFC